MDRVKLRLCAESRYAEHLLEWGTARKRRQAGAWLVGIRVDRPRVVCFRGTFSSLIWRVCDLLFGCLLVLMWTSDSGLKVEMLSMWRILEVCGLAGLVREGADRGGW